MHRQTITAALGAACLVSAAVACSTPRASSGRDPQAPHAQATARTDTPEPPPSAAPQTQTTDTAQPSPSATPQAQSKQAQSNKEQSDAATASEVQPEQPLQVLRGKAT